MNQSKRKDRHEGEDRRQPRFITSGVFLLALMMVSIAVGCGYEVRIEGVAEAEPRLVEHGSIEITGQLLEIPEGAIFKRDLYDYVTLLKYRVVRVHRGEAHDDTIFVGH